jgi:hypothetical protein
VSNYEGSGAYGIPQSLPASKMRAAGADYMTNPATQIKWGLNYIRGRYGNPAGALAFHNANNWYERGGRVERSPGWGGWHRRGARLNARGPTLFGAGEGQPSGGRERVTVERMRPGARTNASGGGGISVQVTFTGPVHIRDQEDANRIMERAAEHAARKLIGSLERAGVSDKALAGA